MSDVIVTMHRMPIDDTPRVCVLDPQAVIGPDRKMREPGRLVLTGPATLAAAELAHLVEGLGDTPLAITVQPDLG
jgi:hypothetical protein